MKKRTSDNYQPLVLMVLVCISLALMGLFVATEQVVAQTINNNQGLSLMSDKKKPRVNEDVVLELASDEPFSAESLITFQLPQGIEWQPQLTKELNDERRDLSFRWDEKTRLVSVKNAQDSELTEIEIGVTGSAPGTFMIKADYDSQAEARLDVIVSESQPLPPPLKSRDQLLPPGLANLTEVPFIQGPNTRAISRNPIDHLGLVINEKFQEPIGTGPYFLTPKILVFTDQKDEMAAIWSKKKLNLSQDFKLGSYLFLGDRAATLAGDGMTFTLQADDRMANSPELVMGVKGTGLGVYGDGSGVYVRNALSIEFDTYHNADGMDKDIGINGRRGHIAVAKPKLNNQQTGEHMHTQLALTNHLSNNMWRRFEVWWDSEKKEMSFSLVDPANKTDPWSYGRVTPGTQTITFPVDPIKEFGGEDVYWGFTGSTGSNYQENAIVIDQVPQEPIAEQTNTIQNITTTSNVGTSVKGTIGEVVEVMSNIEYLSGYYPWEKIITDYTIPEGLEYVPNSSLVDDVPIADTEIEFNPGKMSYPMYGLTKDSREKKISYQLKIKENETKRYEIASQSVGEELTVEGNTVTIENEELGVVNVTYQDDLNNILDTKQLKGKSGTAYMTEQLTFDGLQFIEVDPQGSPATGTFKKDAQTVTYQYQRLYLTADLQVLHQGTTQAATTARVTERLNYQLKLTSHYAVPGVFYDELRVKLPLDSQLENLDLASLKFRSEDGGHVLAASYDELTHEVVGSAKEPVPRHLNYLLDYTIAVKDLAPIGSLIKAQATVNGKYSDSMELPTIESNEVVTEIIPGFLEFVSAPENLSFGKRKIAVSEQTYAIADNQTTKNLTVKDNRTLGSTWSMKAKINKTITGKTSQSLLSSDLYYLSNNVAIPLSEGQGAVIYTKVSDSHQLVNISDSWNQQNGLRLKVKPGIAKAETYEGEVEWTLQDGPENL